MAHLADPLPQVAPLSQEINVLQPLELICWPQDSGTPVVQPLTFIRL